jgi:hypothetical protein
MVLLLARVIDIGVKSLAGAERGIANYQHGECVYLITRRQSFGIAVDLLRRDPFRICVGLLENLFGQELAEARYLRSCFKCRGVLAFGCWWGCNRRDQDHLTEA